MEFGVYIGILLTTLVFDQVSIFLSISYLTLIHEFFAFTRKVSQGQIALYYRHSIIPVITIYICSAILIFDDITPAIAWQFPFVVTGAFLANYAQFHFKWKKKLPQQLSQEDMQTVLHSHGYDDWSKCWM